MAILCSGCVSLGPTTSEIHVGDQTVGTVTVTPTDDLFSSDLSTERLNLELDLLSNKSLINSLPDDDKTSLLKLLTGDDSIDLSTFMKNADNDGKDFWSQIMDMKMSNNNNKKLSEVIGSVQIDQSLDKAMKDFEKFLNNLTI